MRLPLHGVRLLDLTTSRAGAYGTRLLADMGVEVIKIESVGARKRRAGDDSHAFQRLNPNKYGLRLDVSDPSGREVFLRLVTASQVVIEDFLSGVMDDLGLTLDAFQLARPDIIMVSLPDWGGSGPEGDRSHPMAGVSAAAAVPLALWALRHLPDVGAQRAEIDRGETVINTIGEYIVGGAPSDQEPAPPGDRRTPMAPHGCYPCCGDDQWVAIACEDDDQFAALCSIIGRAELARDELFTDVVSRSRHREELDRIIAAWTSERSKGEATEALQAVGLPSAPVLSATELASDPHLRARGFFEAVSHPDGLREIDGCPWWLSTSPAHIRLPAPRFGEHNDYVLRHLLGLSDEEVAALAGQGVTGDAPNRAAR